MPLFRQPGAPSAPLSIPPRAATGPETIPRSLLRDDQPGFCTSGATWLQALPVLAGVNIARLAALSASVAMTPGATPHIFFGLYDDDLGSDSGTPRKRLAISADDFAAGWPANTLKTLAMTTAYSARHTGFLYAACLIVAAVTPSMLCFFSNTPALNLVPVECGNSGAGLVTLADPAAAPVPPDGRQLYMYASQT